VEIDETALGGLTYQNGLSVIKSAAGIKTAASIAAGRGGRLAPGFPAAG
jgi:hypothetical protein